MGPEQHFGDTQDRVSGDFSQFRHTAHLDPLDHENIAFVIEAGTMWADKLSRNEARTVGCVAGRIWMAIGSRIAQMENDFVVLVDQRHARLEIGNYHISFLFVEMARQSKAGNEVDELSAKSKPLQPVVSPVSHNENWIRRAIVHPNSVRLFKMSRIRSAPAIRIDVPTFVIVMVDVIGA